MAFRDDDGRRSPAGCYVELRGAAASARGSVEDAFADVRGTIRGAVSAGDTVAQEIVWIKSITITTGLVSATTVPTLLQLVRDGRLDAEKLGTHHFELGDIMRAYDVFSAPNENDALKVVLNA